MASGNEPYTPPRWKIDLSLPPKDRYREIARCYKQDVQGLTGLFDALLRDVAIQDKYIPSITRLSRLLLRRVHDNTQTDELRGISEESGISMYLLVAFNVILDLLMGCTSGGVRSLEKTKSFTEAKMLHFRTLDWTMDPLRRIIVQLDFIRSKSDNPNSIVASSITYVGFTGVLTGVRPGLSMSLNFRGLHDNSSKAAKFRFYFHHLLVLLGHRPSIATYLRRYLTGDHEFAELFRKSNSVWPRRETCGSASSQPARLADVCRDMPTHHTTAAYLIFSDGDSTISIDKDFRTSKIRRSRDFIATTNHDVVDHDEEQKENMIAATAVQQASRHAAGLSEFLDESKDRLKCMTDRWRRLLLRKRREQTRTGATLSLEDIAGETSLTPKQVIDWLSKYPTTNECTHFATVMDPRAGTIAWCLAYPEPLSGPS